MIETHSGLPGEDFKVVGQVFGVPLVTKGLTWLPLTEVGVWAFMTWYAGKNNPERTWSQRLGVGALTMPVILGSEWGHNLAHAAAAKLVAKPMDALRVTWGMPLVVYFDTEDKNVTPTQHIMRSVGGPIFNSSLLLFCLALRGAFKPDSLGREVANVAVGVNAFLSSVSLLPIPGIDGGSILKWSLVKSGQTHKEADKTVRKVNGLVGALLAVFSGALFKRRKHLLGGFIALMAAICMGVASGRLREEKSSPWMRS
ncbi:hypothetical protein ACFLZW_06910 [Chloroflexota bacterium]